MEQDLAPVLSGEVFTLQNNGTKIALMGKMAKVALLQERGVIRLYCLDTLVVKVLGLLLFSLNESNLCKIAASNLKTIPGFSKCR